MMTTSTASLLIQKLFQFLPLPSVKTMNKTSLPLLDNDEIIDLLHRVKNKKHLKEQINDIAQQNTGDKRSVYRGQGMDYEESRRYQAGDDPRHMNWQLTARTGQHYMKVFREERQPGIFILVDRRPSMRFGTRKRLKVTQAARAAAIAAFSALENNFSVGGIILDDKVEWFKDSQSKQAVFDFIHQAARPARVGVNIQATVEPKLEEVLKMINVILSKGSLVYLISDFYDLNEECQPSLLELSSTHQVNAIHITDPAEINLPNAGKLSLKSALTAPPISIDSSAQIDNQKYHIAASDYFTSKKKLIENCAANYQKILTTIDAIEQNIKL